MTSSRERGRDAPRGLGVTGVNAAAFVRVLHHAPYMCGQSVATAASV